MNILIVTATLLAGPTGLPLAVGTPPAAPNLALESSIVLNVAAGRPAGDAIVKQVESLGGYFASRQDLALVLKVPVQKSEALLTFIETLGTVLQRQQRADDLQMTLEQQRTRVKSKQAMLEQYMKVLETANARAIVSVEQQITALVQEIEQLRGAIKLLEHRLQMATVRVSFQLEKRETPVADGHSPFPWLNTVNLVELYGDFRDVPE